MLGTFFVIPMIIFGKNMKKPNNLILEYGSKTKDEMFDLVVCGRVIFF